MRFYTNLARDARDCNVKIKTDNNVKLKNFDDVEKLAVSKGPGKMVVLAPEDIEFIKAVKISKQNGIIEPILIGNPEKLKKAGNEAQFDISGIQIINESDPQKIADLGVSMLFDKEVDITGKGQIPTSYIYRSILKKEKALGKKKTISVNSIWDIPDVGHPVSITDPGVNILPDYETKKEIALSGITLFHLLGYKTPEIGFLAGNINISDTAQAAYSESVRLAEEFSDTDQYKCKVANGFSIAEILFGKGNAPDHIEQIDIIRLPHILLVPNLEAGNILSKIDLFLGFKRCSVILSSAGPVMVPSRSDISSSIAREIALGITLSSRLREIGGDI